MWKFTCHDLLGEFAEAQYICLYAFITQRVLVRVGVKYHIQPLNAIHILRCSKIHYLWAIAWNVIFFAWFPISYKKAIFKA